MSETVQIRSKVPFGHALCLRHKLTGQPLEQIVRHTPLESHYLAWETVRQQTNPFFCKGTGFEGYLVGCCPTAEAALELILTITQTILERIARLYRFQYGFRSHLMKTLTKEEANLSAMQIWSTFFGAELGRLRAQILTDPQAQAFRAQTYHVVDTLPPIIYRPSQAEIEQAYLIGADNGRCQHKLSICCSSLPPAQQDAWLVAENIGEFGHPLVRLFFAH